MWPPRDPNHPDRRYYWVQKDHTPHPGNPNIWPYPIALSQMACQHGTSTKGWDNQEGSVHRGESSSPVPWVHREWRASSRNSVTAAPPNTDYRAEAPTPAPPQPATPAAAA